MKQILNDYAPILNVTPDSPLLDQKPSRTTKVKALKTPKKVSPHQTSKSATVPSNDKKQSVKVVL